jgi:hypothetical protein
MGFGGEQVSHNLQFPGSSSIDKQHDDSHHLKSMRAIGEEIA